MRVKFETDKDVMITDIPKHLKIINDLMQIIASKSGCENYYYLFKEIDDDFDAAYSFLVKELIGMYRFILLNEFNIETSGAWGDLMEISEDDKKEGYHRKPTKEEV